MNEVDEILAAQGELTSNDDSHPLVRDYLHKRRRARGSTFHRHDGSGWKIKGEV